MKDHEIRELVNQLRDVTIKYHGAGQLREQIARTVRAAILQAQSDDDGEPTDDERIMAIDGIHSCERCGDEGWVVGEMGITRCACGQAGNCRKNANSSTNNFREIAEMSTNSLANPGYLPDGINIYHGPQDESTLVFRQNDPVIGIDLASGFERFVEVRYVAPPGYVMVPKEPTDEMLAAAKEWTGLTSTAEVVYIKMLAAAPQEVNHG